MSRQNEHDAHRALRPKSYAEGYLDAKRELKHLLTDLAYTWAARCAFAFVAGVILGLVRGAL